MEIYERENNRGEAHNFKEEKSRKYYCLNDSSSENIYIALQKIVSKILAKGQLKMSNPTEKYSAKRKKPGKQAKNFKAHL